MDKLKRLVALRNKLDRLNSQAYEATKRQDFDKGVDDMHWRRREPVYKELKALEAEVISEQRAVFIECLTSEYGVKLAAASRAWDGISRPASDGKVIAYAWARSHGIKRLNNEPQHD